MTDQVISRAEIQEEFEEAESRFNRACMQDVQDENETIIDWDDAREEYEYWRRQIDAWHPAGTSPAPEGYRWEPADGGYEMVPIDYVG